MEIISSLFLRILMMVVMVVMATVPIGASSMATSTLGSAGSILGSLSVGLSFVAFGALSLVDANLAWQSVNIRLASANPLIQQTFKSLKSYLSQQRGAKKLQYKAFTEADCDAAGGTVVLDAAHTLHAIYTKKENSATDNWFWAYDDATNDGTAADARVCIPQLVANEENCFISPAGIAMTTGLVVTQYVTDPLGATDGSTGADGFVLVAA